MKSDVRRRHTGPVAASVVALALTVAGVAAVAGGPALSGEQTSPAAPTAQWRSYAGDLRNQHYSPLDQINAGNFGTLEIAWRFKTDAMGPRPEFKLEGTALMVNGVVFTTAGT